MKVIWDPEKPVANLRKHKVSFAEAQSVLEAGAIERLRYAKSQS